MSTPTHLNLSLRSQGFPESHLQRIRVQSSVRPSQKEKNGIGSLKDFLSSVLISEETARQQQQDTAHETRLKIWKTTHKNMVQLFVEGGCCKDACWEECRFAFNTHSDEIPISSLSSHFNLIQRDDGTKFNSVVVLKDDSHLTQHLVRNPHPHFDSNQPVAAHGQERDSLSCRLEMLFYAHFLCANRDDMDLLSVATSTRWYFSVFFDRAFPSYTDFIHTLCSTHDRQKVLGFPHARCNINTLRQIGDALIAANECATNATIRYAVIDTRSDVVRQNALVSNGNEGAADAADEMLATAIEFTTNQPHFVMIVVFPFDVRSIFIFRRGGLMRLDVTQFDEIAKSMCEMRVGHVANEVEVVSIRRYFDGRCEYGVCGERDVEADFDDDELEVLHVDDLLEEC